MGKHIYNSGDIFGKFVLSGKCYLNGKRRYIEVLCECGIIKWVRFDSLYSGKTTSCGCAVVERLKYGKKPALIHGKSDDPIYAVYRCMIVRCYGGKKSNRGFRNYEGRGVTVCNEWRNDFMAFYDWAKDKWQNGLQLDKDKLYNEKHGTRHGMIYSPEYCCFLTQEENNKHRIRTRNIEFNGFVKTLKEWSVYLCIDVNTLRKRLSKWSIEKAFTHPIYPYQNKKAVINQARN